MLQNNIQNSGAYFRLFENNLHTIQCTQYVTYEIV